MPHLAPKNTTNTNGLSRRGQANLRKELRDAKAFPALPAAVPVKQLPKPPMAVSYRDAAAVRGRDFATRDVSKYASMMLNPFQKENACRYPDETIVATGMVHLSRSLTTPVTPAQPGDMTANIYTALSVKAISNLVSFPAGAEIPFTISEPQMVHPGSSPSLTFSAATYGAQQTAWQATGTPGAYTALNAIDRTLACGIRVSLTGLPTSTFMPSGTLYFLQLQEYEFAATVQSLSNEASAVAAVTAGKGFSCTVNELSQIGSIAIPYLPQGPMSFNFTDNHSYTAFGSGQNLGSVANMPSSSVSALPRLVVMGYGLQVGVELRFEYSHHIEYVPVPSAAGLILTAIEPPSVDARQGIARAAQIVQSTITGRTTAKEVAPVVSAGARLGEVAGSIGKMALGAIPGGSLIAKGASALGGALGAPKWLQSMLGALAS